MGFIAVTISLFSGFYSLGAVSFLYIKYRTRILRLLLLFLVSLLLISLGSWFRVFEPRLFPEVTRIVSNMLSLVGLALNIIIVPLLISALVSYSLEGQKRIVLLLWDILVVISCVAFPFVSNPEPIFTILNVQLVLTILSAIVFLALNIPQITRLALKRALQFFLLISSGFLVLLIADILVTRFEIHALDSLDGLSLPAYLVALNIGSFFFAGRFLNSDPLLEGGHLTDACKAEFSLTSREVELIERLMAGCTNQELAEAMCISRKTVENHLYNIFQKLQVRNRLQLVSVLKAWNKDT